MTKSDDLADIITRNMNKNKVTQSAGRSKSLSRSRYRCLSSECTKSPLVLFADEPTDIDLIDKLYFKSKYKPLEE